MKTIWQVPIIREKKEMLKRRHGEVSPNAVKKPSLHTGLSWGNRYFLFPQNQEHCLLNA